MPFMVLGFVLFLLVLVSVGVAVFSLAGFAMPWLIIGLVFWAILSGGRRSHRRGWRGGCGRTDPVPISRAPNVRQRVERPRPPARPAPTGNELPIDVQIKVEQIRRKVEVLLGYAPRFPPFSKDLYIVRQTANDYLPRTIHAYLALPPLSRERVVAANGKTALQELRAQLGLLDAKLDEIAEDLQRRDLDRLLANRRFLEERFGEQTA